MNIACFMLVVLITQTRGSFSQPPKAHRQHRILIGHGATANPSSGYYSRSEDDSDAPLEGPETSIKVEGNSEKGPKDPNNKPATYTFSSKNEGASKKYTKIPKSKQINEHHRSSDKNDGGSTIPNMEQDIFGEQDESFEIPQEPDAVDQEDRRSEISHNIKEDLGDSEDPSSSIVLKQGILKGTKMMTQKKNEIYAYWKIPYAKPPVGHLRFREPQDPEPWDGVWNAMHPGKECIQRNIYWGDSKVTGDEDCLHLNIFTPNTSLPLRPVMVYIHGGGFLSGSGKNHGPEYLLDQDVVLVTFNYRLGVLGFLSTGDEECPGNNGLKDQVAALRWVRENIAAFGGNSGSVTIFGESAGGASVHYHMLSPASRGLFHRAISQSGTALCPWALASTNLAVQNAKKLGNVLGCRTDYSVDLINCLKKKAASQIVESDGEFKEWSIHPMIPFRPVVEFKSGGNAFIPEIPSEMVHTSTALHHIPWMVGINSEEGALAAARIFGDNLEKELEDRFFELVPMALYYRETSYNLLEETRRLAKFYFGGTESINNSTIMQLVDLFTDGWFLQGTDRAVRLHSLVSKAPIYYYYFFYRGESSFSSLFGDPTRNYGVCHGDDLIYLFPCKEFLKNITLSDKDEKMRDIMTSLWSNFAKYGDPTPQGEARWRPVSIENVELAHLDVSGVLMARGKVEGRARFWTNLRNQG